MEAGVVLPRSATLTRWQPIGEWLCRHPVRTLFACWLAQIGWLLALQLAGAGYGFDVWPMGEDRNWLRFMLDAPGIEMMRQFWRTNDRNPLSPWWYWLFSWPISHLDWGLYALRRLVDLLLSISVAMLLAALFRDRDRPWALAGGLLVLACSFNGFREQIVWNFQVASALGLLALLAYVRFVDEGGRRAHLLAASLVVYLVSIATYTLNAGLLVTVTAVALLRRGPAGESGNLRMRLTDIACFSALTVVFLLAWYTTTRPSSTYYGLDLALATRQFGSSVAMLLWHPDYTWYLVNAWREPSVLIASLPPVAIFAGVALAAILAPRGRVWLPGNAVAWMVALVAGVAASVVALESTSAVWLPGYRSKMFYQLTAPLLALVAAASVALALARWVSARAATLWVVVAIPAAVVITFPASTLYNRLLVEKTRAQKSLMAALDRLADEQPDVRTFVIRHVGDSTAVWGSDALSDNYVKTMLKRPHLSMRFLQRQPAPQPDWAGWWRVVIGRDEEGARNTALPNAGAQPYHAVRFVDWDGRSLVIPATVDAAWFSGWQADWKRDTPILQRAADPPSCPTQFDFSLPAIGRGWSVPERHPSGGYAMWMADRTATLTLTTACTGDVMIELVVAGYMADDIFAGLRLKVDGRDVQLDRGMTERREPRLTGRLELAPQRSRVTLEFSAPRTVVPAGGTRTLAVMFKRATLAPAQPR